MLRAGDLHAVGSQAVWLERSVAPEDECWVVRVEQHWAFRTEVGQVGCLVELVERVDSQDDCLFVPVERCWAVPAEVAQVGYLVV